MEDPIRFDLWCECERVNRDAIASYLGRLSLSPKPAAPDSKRLTGQRMLLRFHGRSWCLVEAMRENPPPWLVRLAVYQEGYGPAKKETLQHCERHDLHYAGVIGCHVCTGFFEGNLATKPGPQDPE